MSQKRSQRKERAKKDNLKRTILFELYGLILLAISLIALIQTGAVGATFRKMFRFFAGSWDFIIPLYMVGLSLYIMAKRHWPKAWSFRWSGIIIICLSILIFSHISLVEEATANGRYEGESIVMMTWNMYQQDRIDNPSALGGGMIGALFYDLLNLLFEPMGAKIIVFFLVLIGILLITGKSYTDMFMLFKNKVNQFLQWMGKKRREYQEMTSDESEESNHPSPNNELPADAANENNPLQDNGTFMQAEQGEQTEQARQARHSKSKKMSTVNAAPPQQAVKAPEIYDFTEVAYSEPTEHDVSSQDLVTDLDNGDMIASEMSHLEEEEKNYQLPPYSILIKQQRKTSAGKDNIASNATKLEQTLQSFGVQAKVTQVHRGPAVTRYEVYPDVGVKVSRIVSLTDDIALALAAKGIRIEAPIPGKSAIGIEVPNEDVAIVTLREVLESSQYHESESKLSIGLGRDISGEPIVAQLNKMPHLLVAGATGSGKSVCINGIIASVLYKAKPHEVKLMMIDPKMVELNVYNGIPHLLAPVVTDPRKASIALKKVVAEMERRYDLFAHCGTRNIEGYNEFIRKENERHEEANKPLLPYIVVIVDELADLMMVAPGDVEDAICRLAQMARAAGIHLIIATQRPSVDVITGVIKANIPSRIAFGVSAQTDSRTILDMGGAEKLLGRGDMLFLPVGASKPLRIQGAFVSDEEIEKLVAHCIEQQKAKYNEEMIPQEIESNENHNEVQDEIYNEAVELIIGQGSASVSMLQRRFRIGYTRAARLIDAMEANGIVGPYEGSKPRDVLISKEESNIS